MIWLGHTTLTVEDCEDSWAEYVNADVTSSIDSSDFQVGSKSVSLTLTGTVTAGNRLATEVVSLDLSAYSHVAFWIKSSVTLSSGSLVFCIDEDAACGSPSESLVLPALVADEWTAVCLEFAAATSTRNAVISVGLKVGSSITSGAVILVDDVRALTAAEFETLGVRGLDRPDDVIQSKGQVIELIDGDLHEVVPVKSRRVITIEFNALEADELAWIEDYLKASDKRVIGTNDFVRVVSGDPGKYSLEWLNGISLARRPILRLVEKTGWTKQPSSWSYT